MQEVYVSEVEEKAAANVVAKKARRPNILEVFTWVIVITQMAMVDGWDAASFVQALKRYLETPVLLFAD